MIIKRNNPHGDYGYLSVMDSVKGISIIELNKSMTDEELSELLQENGFDLHNSSWMFSCELNIKLNLKD